MNPLLNGPQEKGYKDTIPKGTKVNSVVTKEGICYIDLSSEFLTQQEGVSPEVVIYSVVNSLAELPTVNKVQFTVNGEKVKVGEANIAVPWSKLPEFFRQGNEYGDIETVKFLSERINSGKLEPLTRKELLELSEREKVEYINFVSGYWSGDAMISIKNNEYYYCDTDQKIEDITDFAERWDESGYKFFED